MTEEQRRAALEAIDRLENDAMCYRDGYGETRKDAELVRAALQSPPVPVIEGLEEATSYIIGLVHTAQRNIKLCNLTQADLEYKKADMLLTCVKVCEEYSKLQKEVNE